MMLDEHQQTLTMFHQDTLIKDKPLAVSCTDQINNESLLNFSLSSLPEMSSDSHDFEMAVEKFMKTYSLRLIQNEDAELMKSILESEQSNT